METKTIQIPKGWVVDKEQSTDTNIVLKEIEKDWKDTHITVKGYYISDTSSKIKEGLYDVNVPANYNVFATEKQAKSALAMARISQIIANDERFGGAITDEEWLNSCKAKHCILHHGTISGKHTIVINTLYTWRKFLAFHTKEQAILFREENLDLIADYLMIDYEDIHK